MQITDIRIRKVEKEGKMRAVASDARDRIQNLILGRYQEEFLMES